MGPKIHTQFNKHFFSFIANFTVKKFVVYL
jgi:hypothetical protein